MATLLDILLHLDTHLNTWVGTMGPWIYVVLFLIIFCETGLVVTPFLPGDSLLFALGALSATENSPLNVVFLFFLLTSAGIIGNSSNYAIGRYFGPKVFNRENSIFLNKHYLLKAQTFYEKYGGRAIVLSRFVPILRTFAPFVAGVGQMTYARFSLFNISGAIAWVGSFLVLGYCFGNLQIVKQNFHIVIFAIIAVSVLPAIYEIFAAKKSSFSK